MKNNSVERYSNHLILKDVGGYGQKLLKESKVLIVGLGGLGCPVLQYAAGSGIGNIGLIDNDDIDISNLQRQTIFSMNDLGKPKVEIAEKFLHSINPEINAPTNPKRAAIVLFNPTFSFKKIAAKGTTKRELENLIAWASARGILTIA